MIDARHQELFSRFNSLLQACNGATLLVMTTVSQTLLDWLLKHVKQTDVKLGRFLSARAA
ncbi:MAG: hypothetical protein FIB02_03920 [Desulfuromonas sp.]|nr:hypothetical protein [Desulfuromonas sp.]